MRRDVGRGSIFQVPFGDQLSVMISVLFVMSPAYHRRACALWLLYRELVGGKLLRLPISIKRVEWHGMYTEALISPLSVDAQSLKVVVDTGAPHTFFISNQSLIDGEPCDGLPYGCYQCSPKACDDSEEVEFYDGRSTNLLRHIGALKLGEVTIPEVEFGLIGRYSTSASIPHASLGLGPRDEREDGDWVPLLDQLLNKGMIPKREFSIYFGPDNINEGELILGGEDATKYQEPLQQVPLTVGADSWAVDIKSIKVGGKSVPMTSASYSIMIDSGADGLYASLEFIRPILTAIESRLMAIGRSIVYDWDSPTFHRLQSCDDRKYLPPLNLVLRGESGVDVILEVPRERYIEESLEDDDCHLLIKEFPEGYAIGVSLIRQYYLHYQGDNGKIGIALAKRKSRKLSDPRKRRLEAESAGARAGYI